MVFKNSVDMEWEARAEFGAEKKHGVTYSNFTLASGYKMDWKGPEQKQKARLLFCELRKRGDNGTQLIIANNGCREMKIDSVCIFKCGLSLYSGAIIKHQTQDN